MTNLEYALKHVKSHCLFMVNIRNNEWKVRETNAKKDQNKFHHWFYFID